MKNRKDTNAAKIELMKKWRKAVCLSPEVAHEMLIEHNILTEDGDLHPNYFSNDSVRESM